LDYDFLEYLKRNKSNISLFELMNLPQIQEFFNKTLQGSTSKNTQEANVGIKRRKYKVGQTTKNTSPKRQSIFNASLTGKRSRSNTPSFLSTFDICNKKLHNCMVDLGASSNVMTFKVCEKINVKPEESDIQIIQMDITRVKVIGELKNVLIRLSSNRKVHHTIDIIVVDILDTCGMILSRDWSIVLNGYFSIDWSHLWLAYNGKSN
jgi:hypothetical protein